MEYTDEMKAIVSKLARIDSAISTLEEQRKAEIQRLVELGCTGQSVPSTSGDIVACLTCGFESKLNEDRAKLLFPDEYDRLLEKKRAKVKLTVTDVRTNCPMSVDKEILARACDTVYATVKATIKHL